MVQTSKKVMEVTASREEGGADAVLLERFQEQWSRHDLLNEAGAYLAKDVKEEPRVKAALLRSLLLFGLSDEIT
ncbi:hypothetical protein TU77_28335 [Pseudomonas synxantha]|nr:hypothetical protein TU77_28335 [Pseudomonas synxantha]